MKLKDYARQQGVSYRTAWRWWKAGKLPGHQMDTGTILIEPAAVPVGASSQHVAIYARVSSAEHKSNLDSQRNGLPHTAQHGAIRWRRWSKKSGLASMMVAQSCWHFWKIKAWA